MSFRSYLLTLLVGDLTLSPVRSWMYGVSEFTVQKIEGIYKSPVHGDGGLDESGLG